MSESVDSLGEARPGPAEEAAQPHAPTPRRPPPLPVRFEDPVAQSFDERPERRPVFYQNPRAAVYERERRQTSAGAGRSQHFYEDADDLAEGGPSSSSLLGERERERESPTPIVGMEKDEGDADFVGARIRDQRWSGDEDPFRNRNRVRVESVDDDALIGARLRRPRQPSYEAQRPRDRPNVSASYDQSDYEAGRRFRSREHRDSYYNDEDEIDIHIPRSREREREHHGMNSYYDDDDEVDIQVRRGRIPPVRFSEHRHRSSARPYSEDQSNSYLVPALSGTRNQTRPPTPITHRNRIYDYEDELDYRVPPTVRSRSAARSQRRYRSPVSIQPVVINTRVYDEYEDAPTVGKSRSRSRPSGPLPGNIIINNRRAYSDDESETYPPSISHPHRQLEVDLDAISQAYSFSLSRHANNSNGSRSISGSISDISEKSEPQEEEPLKKPFNSGRTRNILSSQYVGDGLIGGRHAVQLTVTPESDPSRRKSVSPIFKWVHFQDTNMDLEKFQNNVLSIHGLTDAENNAISKLFGRAKKKHDKPLQTLKNMKSKYMVPSFMQGNISGEMRPKASRARTISWLCVPYFCLDKYTTPSNLTPSSHPMRTLLQARYSLVQKKRDMEQAVRQLPDTPAEHCFYIAQIWLLILDDSLIVSCAQSPIASLQGDSILIAEDSALETPMALSQNILVDTKNSLLWSLPVDGCQDWFAFVSHFWEYWPRPFQITYREKVITAEDWPKIFVIAKKSGIRLSIDFRPNIKEPVKGILLGDPIPEEHVPKETADSTTSPDKIDPQISSTPSLRVKDHRRSKPDVSPEKTKDGFHVFTWPGTPDVSRDTNLTSPTVNVDRESPNAKGQEIEEDQKEIDDFLRLKTNLNDRLAYRACPFSKMNHLYAILAAEQSEITSESGNNTTDQKRHKRYEVKVDILNAARSIIEFFLPPNSESNTARKYWGALHRLFEAVGMSPLTRSDFIPPEPDFYPNKPDRECLDLVDWLQLVNRGTKPFRDLMSQIPASERSSIEIPEELTRAWLHLLLSFAFLAKDMQVFDEQMVICNDLIGLGTKKVIQNMSHVQLSKYAVFPPSDFASLITFQLLQDVRGSALDISDTYLEYLKSLESKIESNPLDRGHQDRIVSLKQEISVISETLALQQKVLSQAQVGFGLSRIVPAELESQPQEATGYSRSRYYGSRETPHRSPVYADHDPLPRPVQPLPGNDPTGPNIDPSGVQGLLLQDGLAVIEKRIREFREMRDRASDLGDWNIQKIDSNKDRQEAAIYAFTIVTIIFLPLSTVASILGMNTFDVRNMNVNQWVFWATALPLMVLIITLCLIWAGELKNVWEGFSKLWKKEVGSGYRMIDDQAGRRENDRYLDVAVRPMSRDRNGLRNRHTLYGGARESYV